MKCNAILVAAGRGLRTGLATPKQWALLGGRKLADWSVATFANSPRVERIVVVVGEQDLEFARSAYGSVALVVQGGETRAVSVKAGVAALGPELALPVLIHDAARPGLTETHIETLLDALRDYEGAAPALTVADTLKRTNGANIETIDRSCLYRVQTPQAFRADLIVRMQGTDFDDATDDFNIAERLGASLTFVSGDHRLDKVTIAEDFLRMEKLIVPIPRLQFRTGQGFDVHGFESGDYVTLCGIRIPHSSKLLGHSDADVGWHALTDAILGAACLGDIGDHFPPSDPQWNGADSAVFLTHAHSLAIDQGWSLDHADITLICEAPKVKPHRNFMRERTAELLGLPVEAVSVKATTTEGLGFTGRREGIAALASATLSREAPL